MRKEANVAPTAHGTGCQDIEEGINHTDVFTLAESLAYRERVYHLLQAVNDRSARARTPEIFLGMIRILRLLHFQDRLSILTRTLAGSDLVHFALLFAIVLVAYVSGAQGTATTTLGKMVVGVGNDYDRSAPAPPAPPAMGCWGRFGFLARV
eukprot:tig00001535_g9283.t1